MTSGRQHLADVISGEFFGGGRRVQFPPGGLLLVIAQADAIGADPEDDPEGFRADCERKRSELQAQLTPIQSPTQTTVSASLPWSSTWTGIQGGVPRIHLVAADPYGMTARKGQPSPDDYAGSAGWDGVAGLRAMLRMLPAQATALRAAARLRYWSLAGQQSLLLAQAELDQVTLALDEARRAGEHVNGLEARLDAVREAAETDLRLAVLNELRSISESAPAVDFAAVEAEAEQRLLAASEAWELRWRVQLGQLAREGAAEVRARAGRPGAAAFTGYLDELLTVARTPASGGGRATVTKEIAAHAGDLVPTAATTIFHRTTGQTTTEAQATLDRYRHNPDLVLLGGYYDANGAYYTAQQLDRLQHHLHEVQLAQVVPVLVQLAGLLWSSAGERQRSRESLDRQAKLRDNVEQAADRISKHILGQGWTDTVADVRDQFRGQLPPGSLVAGMRAHQEELTAAVGRLRELLVRS